MVESLKALQWQAFDNMQRISAKGVEDKVFPIYAEAHALPFARDFFDAIVRFDAYHYFGTNELYFSYISRFLKKNGRIGIVVPGVRKELTPADAAAFGSLWESDYYTFHGAQWWKDLWQHSGLVTVDKADEMPNGHDVWLHWDKTLKEAGDLKRHGDVELLQADGGNLTLVRIVGTKR